MEDHDQSNDYSSASIFSNSSSSLSSSSATTRSAPIPCEDSSFNSIRSSPSTHTYYSVTSKPLVCHFSIASIKASASQISCLAVQGNFLYAATIKEINVFDLATLALVETFGPGSGWAKSIAFGNGKIFTAHQDCKIRVWRHQLPPTKRKHQLVSTLPTLRDRFLNCLFAKNYVKVRRHRRKLWIQHSDAVSGLAVDGAGGQLYSVSWDKSFKTWKTSSDMQCVDSVAAAHSDAVNAVVVSPSDKTVYTGSADGQIKVWRSSDERRKRTSPAATLSKHDSSVNALALTAENALVSGGGDGVILVWERRDYDGDDGGNMDFFVACCLKGHRGAVLCMVYVNDLLISGSSDRSVRIWKYGKGFDFGGCCVAVMKGHSKPVKSLAAVKEDEDLGEAGFSVMSGSLDGEIRVWKVVISNCSD